MQRAGSFDGDVRALPQTVPVRKRERPEREGPESNPVPLPGTAAARRRPERADSCPARAHRA